ncbi:hypothetical protein [Leifsonia aquatica]|uniref:hypothetical protein n=1 Tax=Leifsonia aquatica TaxID=144185 RepID=UPI00046A094F|nr:hypothetical protein [Leifsonia aquatica]
MQTRNTQIVSLHTTDGQEVLLYPGRDGSLFVERVRPNGRRDAQSIMQFDPSELLSAVSTVSTRTQPIFTVEGLAQNLSA